MAGLAEGLSTALSPSGSRRARRPVVAAPLDVGSQISRRCAAPWTRRRRRGSRPGPLTSPIPPTRAPAAGDEPRRSRPKVAVLAWDVGHNPLGRAHVLAGILAGDTTSRSGAPSSSATAPRSGRRCATPRSRSVAFPGTRLPGASRRMRRIAQRDRRRRRSTCRSRASRRSASASSPRRRGTGRSCSTSTTTSSPSSTRQTASIRCDLLAMPARDRT